MAQAALAASSKARKLDCKCPCTCASQGGAAKAPRTIPLAEKSNQQAAHASQPNSTQQQAAQATLPTLRLPKFSTAAVQAALHPTHASAAVEHFTPAQPVLQAPGIVPEGLANVPPNAEDIEAAEIVDTSPTAAGKASVEGSEPQVPTQSEYSGLLAPHQQGMMLAQEPISTVALPQGMLGTRMEDLGTEDIAVADMDSVQPVAPDMALHAEIQVQPRANIFMNAQGNGGDQDATTVGGIGVQTQLEVGSAQGEQAGVETAPNGAEAEEQICPDQQTWELPGEDIGFYQEGLGEVDPEEMANASHLGGEQVAGMFAAAPLQQMPQHTPQTGMSWGHMQSDLPMQPGHPEQPGISMQPSLPNSTSGTGFQHQMMPAPFPPTGRHPYMQGALGIATNASFAQGPFSGILTPQGGNPFVGGPNSNFVTGQGGMAHISFVPGENYESGRIRAQENTGMRPRDISGAIGGGEAEVAYAAAPGSDRRRILTAPLEAQQGCGQRKRSADIMGFSAPERHRRQRRRR